MVMKMEDIVDFVKENKEADFSCAEKFVVTYKAWKKSMTRKRRRLRKVKKVLSKSESDDSLTLTPTPSSSSSDDSSSAEEAVRPTLIAFSASDSKKKSPRRRKRRRNMKRPCPSAPAHSMVQPPSDLVPEPPSVLVMPQPMTQSSNPTSASSPSVAPTRKPPLFATSLPVPSEAPPEQSIIEEQLQPVENAEQLMAEDNSEVMQDEFLNALTTNNYGRATLDLGLGDLVINDYDDLSLPQKCEIEQPQAFAEACLVIDFSENIFFRWKIFLSNLWFRFFLFCSWSSSRYSSLVETCSSVEQLNFSHWLKTWILFYLFSVVGALSWLLQASLSFWGCCLVVMISFLLWSNLF
jgi:hypothetical protein